MAKFQRPKVDIHEAASIIRDALPAAVNMTQAVETLLDYLDQPGAKIDAAKRMSKIVRESFDTFKRRAYPE